jgi:hypothetical protein
MDTNNSDNQAFNRLIISNISLSAKNNWSPCIEKQLLEEYRIAQEPSVKVLEKSFKSEKKAICLLIGVLALLSIITMCTCTQAASIAQALRETARISLLQIYSR